MKTPSLDNGADFVAAGSILGLASAELAMREMYHRVSSEAVGLTIVAASLLVVILTWLAGSRLAPASSRTTSRILLLLAAGIAWDRCAGISSMLALNGWRGSMSILPAIIVGSLGVLLGTAALTARSEQWSRVRLALLVSLLLFVSSQPVFGWWRAPNLQWPPEFEPSDATADRGRVVTMILLLDELNARNATPIVGALESASLRVVMKAVPSVGANTVNVVPSLFAGQIFDVGEVCGLSTICANALALDFGRVHASRPDIDVVGFFHPYCSIRGLRTCTRATVEMAWFDIGRWKCGLSRRFGWPRGVSTSECRQVYVRSWAAMTEHVLAAAKNVPALTQGGVLFAHIPLPHPPGEMVDEPLASQYDANVKRATELVASLVGKATQSGLQVRVVAFADHPLRQQMWCKSYAPYVWDGCVPVARLADDRVPLIVAGSQTLDLSRYESNLDVFKLASGWKVRSGHR